MKKPGVYKGKSYYQVVDPTFKDYFEGVNDSIFLPSWLVDTIGEEIGSPLNKEQINVVACNLEDPSAFATLELANKQQVRDDARSVMNDSYYDMISDFEGEEEEEDLDEGLAIKLDTVMKDPNKVEQLTQKTPEDITVVESADSFLKDYVDVYASVPKEVWESSKDKIMSLSADGINYNNNEQRMTHDDDYSVDIRVKKEDLEKLRPYTNSLDTRELEEELKPGDFNGMDIKPEGVDLLIDTDYYDACLEDVKSAATERDAINYIISWLADVDRNEKLGDNIFKHAEAVYDYMMKNPTIKESKENGRYSGKGESGLDSGRVPRGEKPWEPKGGWKQYQHEMETKTGIFDPNSEKSKTTHAAYTKKWAKESKEFSVMKEALERLTNKKVIFKTNNKMKNLKEAKDNEAPIVAKAAPEKVTNTDTATLGNIIPGSSIMAIETYLDSVMVDIEKEVEAIRSSVEGIKAEINASSGMSDVDYYERANVDKLTFLIKQVARLGQYSRNSIAANKFDKQLLDMIFDQKA